jgi:hypothetical protein
MKFNKELNKYIHKYKIQIPVSYWFNYKFFKKSIKHILVLQNDLEKQDFVQDDNCFICLDNDHLMKTFCCKQNIHHICYIESVLHTSDLCPMCRNPVSDYFAKQDTLCVNDNYNMSILSLISNIYLNIIKIENIYHKHLIRNEHILHKFCHVNYIAVVKICKKILKLLHIDVWNYFSNIMQKKNIMKIYNNSKHSLLSYLLKLI